MVVPTFTTRVLVFADCGQPLVPDHGSVQVESTTYINTATRSCDEGYDLIGEALIRCKVDGMWSGDNATCSIKGI